MVQSLPLWMGEVPDYEVVGGNMQITVGEFALAMPINVFLVGCAKGKAAIVDWERNRQTATIVQLPTTPEVERRYAVDSGQH